MQCKTHSSLRKGRLRGHHGPRIPYGCLEDGFSRDRDRTQAWLSFLSSPCWGSSLQEKHHRSDLCPLGQGKRTNVQASEESIPPKPPCLQTPNPLQRIQKHPNAPQPRHCYRTPLHMRPLRMRTTTRPLAPAHKHRSPPAPSGR